MKKFLLLFSFYLLTVASVNAVYECPLINNTGICDWWKSSVESTCDWTTWNNDTCVWYDEVEVKWFVASCNLVEENCLEVLPELSGELYFIEQEFWNPINITNEAIVWSPVPGWVYWEFSVNNFINNDINVRLLCTSTACDANTFSDIMITENTVWSLSITDNYWRILTKDFQVWKINKTLPTWTLSYSPNNSTWVNSNKSVTLNWSATVFWNETWNQDWLVWEANPTFLCETEWGCSWSLSIEDSAGNILVKNYNISNIDKTKPTIAINKYTEIIDWKQKIWISCSDESWWSWCVNAWEIVHYIQLWTSSNKCVFDNSWNSKCVSVQTDSSTSDFSDIDEPWVSDQRTYFLECLDDLWWSWCLISKVTWVSTTNVDDVSLLIEDLAWNTLTQHFQISKIDNIMPEINLSWLFTFKANDVDKITINVSDTLSWLNNASYKWWSSCVDWLNIIWTSVNDGDSINRTISWTSTLYICAIDNVWNINEINELITIYPWDLDTDKSEIVSLSNSDKVANNDDEYEYTLTLSDKYGNKIYNKEVDLLAFDFDISSEIIYESMLSTTSGDIALLISLANSVSNASWDIFFKVKSLAPWLFTQRFKILMNNWGFTYVDNATTTSIIKTEKNNNINEFKKPIEWSLVLDEWWDNPEIWKDQKYKIELSKVDNKNILLSNWNLNISETTITNITSWHFWNTFLNIDNNFWSLISNYVWFIWNIGANDNVLWSAELYSNNVIISYILWWKNIKYYLDDFWISWCNIKSLWLKVIWNLQWEWKSNITWQDENFSDLSKWNLRSEIRKNAYILTRWRINNTIVNWIKYVEWNTTISGDDLWYETLIVKNWNVIIDWDINFSNNKLWIMVLQDNYSVISDYNNSWNIYVNNNVEYINAVIYSDGTFRSSDSNWFTYSDLDLNKQLIFDGSLFTRNTIGWAVLANSEYLLPWWQITNSFDLAETYDLNYVRKVDNTCNSENDFSFLIKYNSNIQIDPPKGFDF